VDKQRFQMRTKIPATVLIVLFLCAAAMASQDETAGEGGGIFSGTFADAIWTVVAFVLVAVVLGRFAWRPLLEALQTRQKYIQGQIDTADIARKKAEKMLEDQKQQALQIITDATKQAQKEAEELTEKARREVQEIRLRAQEDIKHAHVAASEQLWKEVGDVVTTLGSEVLERTITPQDNQRFINDAILKLRQKKNE